MAELTGSYNHALVILSVVIAMASSFVALSTVQRIHDSTVSMRRATLWALVFGVSLGTGIWSMHFMAMLALQLPISVRYDLPMTALSLIVAIAFVALGVLPLRRGNELKGGRLFLVGGVVGLGIVAMHYTGMAAIRMHATMSYDAPIVALSALIAVIASTAALWIANRLRSGSVFGELKRKIPAAMIMGLAVSCMHYTGMFAMHIYKSPVSAEQLAGLDVGFMAVALSIILVLVQGSVLISSSLEESLMLGRRLLALEGRYEKLFQQSGAAIMTLKDDSFIDCNQSTLAMFGCASKEAFCRYHPADLSPEYQPDGRDSRSAAHAYIVEAMKQGSKEFEWMHKRVDGLEFPANVQLSSIQVGEEHEIQAVVTDLSYIKQAEQERLESETKFKMLLEFFPSGIAVNIGGKIAYANSALATMFGFNRSDELVGTTMLNYVHEDDRALAIRRKRSIDETGLPVVEIEERFLRKNGESFVASVASDPIVFGQQQAVLVVIRDISELKHTQHRMGLLTMAIEQTTEPMMILDAEGVVEYCNQAAAIAYKRSPTEMIGVPAAMLRGGVVGDKIYHEIIGAVRRGENWAGELSWESEGQSNILARRVSPVFDGDGNITHQIVVDRDITEERQQQEKMEHVQRLESLGVLAGGIAHDFNNLLTAIMGHAALASKRMKPLDAGLDHLKAIESASQRAADLCKQMLAYSGKGKFVVQAIDLSELVEEMMRLLDVSIHKNVVMRYQLAKNLPVIEADLAQMQQVIMNLVINANEAIDMKSGNIMVTTGVMQADEDYLRSVYMEDKALEIGQYVYLEVSDTGCGMSEETKKRLFEPFFTTKFTGRGLGMSAILGIVRGHDGVIKVYSEQGKGTTFKVLFPAANAEVQSLSSDVVAKTYAGSGMVLVVDDEESIRDLATAMLEDAGYHVLQAVDGYDGIEKLKQHLGEVDCVLLDLTMPRMGGEAAYSEMRRIQPNIRVILSSGYNEQAATQSFSGKGLFGFIQKPYLPDVLLAKLDEVLSES